MQGLRFALDENCPIIDVPEATVRSLSAVPEAMINLCKS